ncbi:MAG: ATP-binding protein [Bacillota bacterium]
MANNIARILKAEKVIIYILNNKTNQIHSFSNSSIQFSDELKPEFVLYHIEHDTYSDLFYATMDGINFKDYFATPEIATKTLLCMPINNKANVKGLLQVSYEGYFVYDERQLLYMKSFCKEIAIIIETSRLMGNSVLLQESNHRIKNNLQTIVNIIEMQLIFIRRSKEYDVIEILNSIIKRIQNIAALHEFLSSNLTGESAISLRDIVKIVRNSFDVNEMTINVNMDDIFIPYAKAASISMVINELLTNCYKYAAKNDKKNIVSIECHYQGDKYILKISDNGTGMPEDFDINNINSIGLSIVKNIIQIEFNGRIDIKSSEKGTTVTVVLPATIL